MVKYWIYAFGALSLDVMLGGIRKMGWNGVRRRYKNVWCWLSAIRGSSENLGEPQPMRLDVDFCGIKELSDRSKLSVMNESCPQPPRLTNTSWISCTISFSSAGGYSCGCFCQVHDCICMYIVETPISLDESNLSVHQIIPNPYCSWHVSHSFGMSTQSVCSSIHALPSNPQRI